MMYDIKITETAKADLRDIAFYIAEESKEKDIALKFVGELQEQCVRLSDFPSVGAFPKDRFLQSAGYRYLVYKDYLICYTLSEEEKTVYVQAIFNGKKDYTRVLKKLF